MRADGSATDAFLDARSEGGRATFRDIDAHVASQLAECAAVSAPVLAALAVFLDEHAIATAHKTTTLFVPPTNA